MPDRSALEAAQRRAARAEALAADYAMAMDVLGRLSSVSSEAAVVDMVLEFGQAVFGAKSASMAVYDRHGLPKQVWQRDETGVVIEIGACPRGHEPTSLDVEVWVGGVSVPIVSGGRPLGRIDLEELAYPDALDSYADTLWVLAKTAGMALVMLRAMHGFVPICAGCKAMSDADGTWYPVEQWLSAHSDVMLSHGLCPACFRKAQAEAGLLELAEPQSRRLATG